MRKTSLAIMLLISSVIVSACDTSSQAESCTEEKIIDENLKLKDQIAEMEAERKESDKRDQIEQEVQRTISSFIYELGTGNVETAEMLTTDRIEVTPSQLIFSDGRQLMVNHNNSVVLLFTEAEWSGADSICMSMVVLNNVGESTMKVYVIKREDSWKIDNIGIKTSS